MECTGWLIAGEHTLLDFSTQHCIIKVSPTDRPAARPENRLLRTQKPVSRLRRAALPILLVTLFPASAEVRELVLGVAPLLDEQATHKQFQPLCDYLTSITLLPCRVATRPNYLAYWDTLRRGEDYNLILDDAHFTDYRIQKMNYRVIAKIPDTVTYSLAVQKKMNIDDPAKLVGRRIATLGIPSMGAALLNGLFPQPSQQPILIEIDTAREGFELLRSDKVHAVILPTPLVRDEITHGAPFRVLLSTAPIPH
ncbi:MAG: hypothetical protein OEV31_02005, partial [Gammaproteobacteria bacterium]|nr:hypothetical protein [Gammaproteobacteria bacterium]